MELCTDNSPTRRSEFSDTPLNDPLKVDVDRGASESNNAI